jgi:hypothetical protein
VTTVDAGDPNKPKPLTGEELARVNRELYDRGRAFVAKLAKVRAGLPKRNNTQACPDDAIAARKISEAQREALLVDEAVLEAMETPDGVMPDKKEPWGFLVGKRVFFSNAFKVAHESEFDPKLGRRGLQNSMPSLERYKFVLVPRFTEKRWPVVKDATTFSGGYVRGWLMFADLDSGETLCQAPFEYQMKLVEFHADPAPGGRDPGLEALEGRFGEFVKVTFKQVVEGMSKQLWFNNWDN